MKKLIAFTLLLLVFKITPAQQICPIIPKPVSASENAGVFLLKRNTRITISSVKLKPVAAYLQQQLLIGSKFNLSVKNKTALPAIKIVLNHNSHTAKEGYKLKITNKNIIINASTTDGAFYGVVSLLQLITYAKHENGIIPVTCWDITDAPNYKWRGLMLDESRHFMGKEKVKQLMDWMAFYKLNRFHWHLTDESGWRLEIKQYPKLTLVGGLGNNFDKDAPAKYYTQKDINEMISYAAERHIVIIPEIDMPGHATGANRAYPEYSGGGSAAHPDFTFSPGNPATYTYLTNILKETNALFHSGMIHVGGDEVSFGNEKWKTDAGIIDLMNKQHLTQLTDVEHYFMKRMADSVYRMHSKLLVWDEMADAGLPIDSTIIFWWRQDKPEQLKLALDKGYTTVLCPRLPFYFDFVQDSNDKYGRKWDKNCNTIESVYSFNLDKYQLSADEAGHIAGIQANLWTENTPTIQWVDYLLFPRMSALAEAAWTQPDKKDFANFMERLKPNIQLYKQAGLYYYNPFNPAENPEPANPRLVKK